MGLPFWSLIAVLVSPLTPPFFCRTCCGDTVTCKNLLPMAMARVEAMAKVVACLEVEAMVHVMACQEMEAMAHVMVWSSHSTPSPALSNTVAAQWASEEDQASAAFSLTLTTLRASASATGQVCVCVQVRPSPIIATCCVGVLCGGCAEGSGFSAVLDTCVSCDSVNAVLILALVVVDVLLVVLLLALMLPTPSWLHPTLLYLQILPHLTLFFPVSFEKLRPYAVYLGSALGLYFPYDFCLHSDMPAAGVYALRYVPVLVTAALAPFVLHVRLKKFRPCPWHGVWLLVLLLYTPVLHTSFSLLNCPALEGESFTPRWYVNANVRCFQDASHAPLSLFALLVVALCIALIPLVVLVATRRLTRPYWVHCLEVPLTAPYKTTCQWWCGVELAKRVLLVLFSVAFHDNDYPVMFLLTFSLALSSFFKPYRHMLVNVLEAAYAVDIFVMLALRNTVDLEDLTQILPTMLNTRGDCHDVEGVSAFTLILTPFYFLPIVLALLAGSVWGVWHLYQLVLNKWMPAMDSKKSALSQRQGSILSNSPSHPRTQTVVDLADFEEERPPRRGSLFKTHTRWASRKRKSLREGAKNSASASGGGKPPLKETPMELQLYSPLKVSSQKTPPPLEWAPQGHTHRDGDGGVGEVTESTSPLIAQPESSSSSISTSEV